MDSAPDARDTYTLSPEHVGHAKTFVMASMRSACVRGPESRVLLNVATQRRNNEIGNLEQLVSRSRQSGVMFMSVMDIETHDVDVVTAMTQVLKDELQ